MNTKKVLIFLYDKAGRNRLSRLIDECRQKGFMITVVGPEVEASTSQDLVFKNIEQYRTLAEGFKKASWEAGRLIEEWARIELNDSQTFEDILSYKGISLWKTIETNLLYSLLISTVDKIRIIKKIIKTDRPDRIVILTDEKPIERVFLSLCEALETEVSVFISKPHSKILQFLKGFMVRKTIVLKNRRITLWIPAFLIAELRRLEVFGWHLLGMAKNSIYNYRGKKRKIKGEKAKIIFLTLNYRYADIVVPVIQELGKNGKNEILVVDRRFSEAIERLKQENIPYKVFNGYFKRSESVIMRKERRILSQKWSRLKNDRSFQRSFTYNGIPFWKILEDKFDEFFMKAFPEMIGVIETTRRMVREEAPHVVVVTDDHPPFQKAVVMGSKSLGIPTLTLQAAPYTEIWAGGLISADRVAVDGQYCKDMLVHKGNDPDKIVITGQPRFDPLTTKDKRFDKEGICKELGLDSKRKLVTFFTQASRLFIRGNAKEILLNGLLEAVKSLPDVNLVIKIRPDREFSEEIYRHAASEVGLEDLTILKNTDLWKLLHISDAVVVTSSTVGYETIVMDKPLIQDNITKSERDYLDYTKDGAAIPVYDIGHIRGAIEDALYDQEVRKALQKSRRRFIEYNAFKLDGEASSRVADLIEDMSVRCQLE